MLPAAGTTLISTFEKSCCCAMAGDVRGTIAARKSPARRRAHVDLFIATSLGFSAQDCGWHFSMGPHSPNPLSPGLPPTLTGERGLKKPTVDRISPSSPVRVGGRPGEEGRGDEGQRAEDTKAAPSRGTLPSNELRRSGRAAETRS